MTAKHPASIQAAFSNAARRSADVVRSFASKAAAWLIHIEDHPRDETEFLPAALEIIDTPPSPLARATAQLIVAFLLVAIVWASIGSVDVIAIAPGRIVPTSRTKLIQPLEAGVVRAIHVHDGETVKAGAVLLEIDPTINAAETSKLAAELTEARLDIARLSSLAGFGEELAAPIPKDATPAQLDVQRRMLAGAISEVRARLAGLDEQIAQNAGNQQAIQSTIDKIKAALPMLEKRSTLYGYLSRKGYGSKINTLTSEQDLVEHRHELQVQTGRLAEAQSAGHALSQQRRQAEAEFQRATLGTLADAQAKAKGLEQQLVQAQERTRLQTLTAPVDGTVQQLAVHTEGGVVTPAQVLLALVPADAGLEIEAAIPNKDIGFVAAGQKAAIKVDTFNFTKYGLIDGTVISVSQDAVTRDKAGEKVSAAAAAAASATSSEPQGQELVYIARVALGASSMDIDGRRINLSPGMAVTAEIKTGSRHLIEYLLSPLQRTTHQAMRER